MATFNGTTLTGDNFVGSIEVDTVTYADSTNTEGVDASLAAGGSTGDAAGDHYSSIENLTGSTFDDALVGDDGGNVLTGLSGADSIFGQGGDDTIDGGSGKDTLDGGSGNDTITFDGSDFSIAGGTGTDTLMVTGAATINLSAADQSTGDTASVTGFENVDASGSSVAVSLTGDSGNNKLTGSNYAETLTGGQGADTLDGGGGDDTFTIASGEFVSGDSIQGGADSDKINVTATTANFTVGSISGVETLTTQGSDQTVTMTATQWAGFVNQIDLGSGTDLLKVLVSGASGNDISLIPVTATYTNIETVNLIGTANGATTNDTLKLTGTQLDKILSGTTTNTIDLRDGTDTITLTSTSSMLNTLAATDGSISGVETISFAGAASDVTINLSGQTEAFTITGGSGADSITGGSGKDTIAGGAGADTIDGGSGNDTINIANGDFVSGESIQGNGGSDTIVLTNATTVDFTGGTVSGIETLTGSSGDDTVTVRSSQLKLSITNSLDLGSGTDVLNVVVSGNGNYILPSGLTISGVETGHITGTAGQDAIRLTGAQLDAILGTTTSGTIDLGGNGVTTFDTIYLTSTSTKLNALGQADDASIQNVESIDAYYATAGVTINMSGQSEGIAIYGGDSGNDTITGGSGADDISGRGGDDTITIANGDFVSGESIQGNSGSDTIVLTNATTVDFTGGTVSGVETLTGSTGDDTVTVLSSQLKLSITNSLDLGSGTDVLNVVVSGIANYALSSGLTISGVETGHITGTTGQDMIQLTGAQLDAILGSSTSGTIDLGGANDDDTIYLTSTSTKLNALANGSLVEVDIIDAYYATAGVTIDMSGQSEGIAIYGGDGSDILTGGSGKDTLKGAAGADIVDGGGGDDTFLIGSGGGIQFVTGDFIQGNTGSDTILLSNGDGVTADLSLGTVSGVETLTGTANIDTVTMTASQWAGFNTIDLASGTDVLNVKVSGSVNITSAVTTVSNVETSNLTGSTGDDTVTMLASQLAKFNTIDLGGGTDVLNVVVSGTGNYILPSGLTISGVETGHITGTAGQDVIRLTGAQLDAILGTGGTIDLGGDGVTTFDTIYLTSTSTKLNALANGSLVEVDIIDAYYATAGVTINLGGQSEGFYIYGANSADTITGGSGKDTIKGDGGADIVDGGGGDDTFLVVSSEFVTGDSIQGNTGSDTIKLSNSGGVTVDFSLGTVSGVETLTDNGGGGNDNVTMTASQWAGFSTIDLAGGTDVLSVKVSGSVNITSALTTVSNIETGNLTGTTGNDTLTLTGAQLDKILSGATSNTIDLGDGTDTITLTSNSTRLTTLGATDGSISGVEIISASGTTGGVTINLSGQTEGFTIAGGGGNDTITGGGGKDEITGGSGNDAIDGGAGTDDTVIFSGARTDYTITVSGSTGSEQYTVFDKRSGATDGTDTVTNVEFFKFGGGEPIATTALDLTAPTVASVTMGDIALTVGETSTVTITFSEKVTGFDKTDVTVENGTLGDLTSNDEGLTWTGTFTPTADIEDTGNVVTVAATYTDLEGNAAATGSSVGYAVDTKAPTVASVTMGDTALKAGETSTVTITFSEKVTGFDNGDVTVEHGTLGTLATADEGKTWTGTFTPAADIEDTTNVVTVAATYTDLEGNAAATGSSVGYAVDTVAPTVAVTMDAIALKVGETSTVTITFSEKVTGFDKTDVTVENGTLGDLTTNDEGLTWTGTFTPTADIEDIDNVVTVTGAYTDPAGNAGATGTSSDNYAVDTKAPTVAVTMSDAALKAGETSTVTITFSEKVTGFDETDVTVENGTLGALTTNDEGVTWTGTFTPTASIEDTTNAVTVAADYADLAGNAAATGSSVSYTIDTKAPMAPAALDLAAASDTGEWDADNVTKARTPTFTGTAESGSTVTLLDGLTQIGSATADGSGAWSITSLVLGFGGHSITAKAKDAAGNVSVASGPLSVTVENTPSIDGTTGNDTLGGTAGNDTINGFAGNDVITGVAGDDIIVGGAGADSIDGGSGNDRITFDGTDVSIAGGLGTDTLVVTTAATINLANGDQTSGDTAKVTGFENVDASALGVAISLTGDLKANALTGGSGADNIDGGAGDDTIVGGAGNDTIVGGTGADMMRGGAGNDTYVVDNVGDKVDESVTGSTGVDTVQSSIKFSLADTGHVLGSVENLTLTGTGSINGTGNAGNNVITGNAGVNVLDGGAGNDTLTGGAGNDTLTGGVGIDALNGGAGNDILTGGTGKDTFLFNTALNATTNKDQIKDFVVLDDTIQLENAVFTALKAGALAAGAFYAGAAAHDADDRIIYNKATGALTYDSNGNAAGGAVQFATLGVGLALTNADFWVM